MNTEKPKCKAKVNILAEFHSIGPSDEKLVDNRYCLGIVSPSLGDSTLRHSRTHSETTIAIDALPPGEALSAMIASHVDALRSVEGSIREIAAAAEIVSDAIAAGKTICYAAAGSSGLMALADASELHGTFGVPQSQIQLFMAGGVPANGHMPGDTEDVTEDAIIAALALTPGDVAIVVSASGTTPYALAFADTARQRSARVIAIANVAGSSLLTGADVAIALNTAAEVVEGSTRLGAGTAQKAALNMISTQAGVLLGHVHDGMMVNLNPDNAKLRKRAVDIVARVSGAGRKAAKQALSASGYDTKLASLVASGIEIAEARARLDRHGGTLRNCLGDLDTKTQKTDFQN